jgi:uncharacterized protein YbjQ (UPF0145 family)
MYCLHQKGYSPGELVIGNSVWSMGLIGSIGAGLNTLGGGEVEQVTNIIHDGRKAAFERMEAWTNLHGAVGISGVTSELIRHTGNIEFLSIGSAVHRDGYDSPGLEFTSSADGQELYCQLDAGFIPKGFAFGNVAYSIGIGGGLLGGLRSLARGEVKEFSEIFNVTRHLALERIRNEAKALGANCVVGINTTIIPFGGMQEMVMLGTASHHPAYGPDFDQIPATSDLTCEETWNMINMGFLPIKLVLGVSVYSLGFVGGISAALKSFVRGEINELTSLIYEARENALQHVKDEAAIAGADDVVGIKTYVYELSSGMIEFMAIGTAVKKVAGLSTLSDTLPVQATMRDRDTFINVAETSKSDNLNAGRKR